MTIHIGKKTPMATYFTTQTPEEIRQEIQETRAEIKILRAKIDKMGLWETSDDLDALEDARENLVFLRELLESL